MVACRVFFVALMALFATCACAQTTPAPTPPGSTDASADDEADRLSRLGWAAYQKRNYTEAERLFRSALALRERTDGPEHPRTASAICNLAVLLDLVHKSAESQSLFERALAIREKVLGPEHPEVAETLDHMARLALDQIDFRRAMELSTRALDMRVKTLGPDDHDVASSMITVGEIAHFASKMSRHFREREGTPYRLAADYYERAIATLAKAKAPEDQKLVECLNNLAAVYAEQKRYDEADTVMKRALPIGERLLAADEPLLASLFERAAHIRRRAHPDTQGRTEAKQLTARAQTVRRSAMRSGRLPSSLAARLGWMP